MKKRYENDNINISTALSQRRKVFGEDAKKFFVDEAKAGAIVFAGRFAKYDENQADTQKKASDADLAQVVL